MPFDFKKEEKQLYPKKTTPTIVKVPPYYFIAVRGKGNPNEKDGQYQKGLQLLYSLIYTIKMSKLSSFNIPGYYDFVVPPLEGFWWQEGIKGVDLTKKDDFCFISLIKLPSFITKEVLEEAKKIASKKKNLDYSKVEYFYYDEGECIQALHIGHYDSEGETLKKMYEVMDNLGYEIDFNGRYHHEIYLNDPRKVEAIKLKTIMRHPVKKKLKTC